VVAGLDARRVGLIMGRRPGSIRVLQHRALQRLAGLLQAADELDESARQ
jgi:DNA-directed RNA polymerase specialized sigma24 family protein